MNEIPLLHDIHTAALRIKPYIHHTPVLTCQSINKMLGAELFFKCENFQKTGSFKMRGASNAIFSLSAEQAEYGVVTHSSGNHGQAIAYAARLRQIPAYVIMPENSAKPKMEAVEDFGATLITCASGITAREKAVQKVIKDTNAHFIPPYNDYRIISGQATATVELIEAVEYLDMVITPVGGGGLLGGTALAAHYLSPHTQVVGAEPAQADDAYRSFTTGILQPPTNPTTIADGLRGALGDKTFPIIQKYVNHIFTAQEEWIVKAMRLIMERMKIIIEPSCALPLAILLNKECTEIKGKRIGIILSGGNVDLDHLPSHY